MARALSARALSARALNRALLARQQLLVPAGHGAPAEPAGPAGPGAAGGLAVERLTAHLVGLQAQATDPPYYGLWFRLPGFRPEQLSELVERRAVVRLGLQRGTIHLVTAEDCRTLRPLFQPVLEQGLRGAFGKRLAGLTPAELDGLVELGRELVEERPRTFQELGTLLATRHPDRDPAALAQLLRARLALVQVPPRGLWRTGGAAAHTTAEHWLGRPLADLTDPAELDGQRDRLVLRYLAAFGPATVADVQKWSGLTRLAAVLKRLRPQLAEFRDEHGRTLYDLPDAPRPPADTAVPVRLVAPFDNLLLSHADRTRVLPEEYRPLVMTQNGIVLGSLLVDGLVAGSWQVVRERSGVARFELRPFAALDREVRARAGAEGERLLEFAAPEAARREVAVSVSATE